MMLEIVLRSGRLSSPPFLGGTDSSHGRNLGETGGFRTDMSEMRLRMRGILHGCGCGGTCMVVVRRAGATTSSHKPWRGRERRGEAAPHHPGDRWGEAMMVIECMGSLTPPSCYVRPGTSSGGTGMVVV